MTVAESLATEWMGITTMKHNRGGYYIKEGVGSIFTHGFMSFASVCIVVACLLIMGSFSLLALNVQEIIGTLENDNQILAFVNEDYTGEQARALQSSLEAVPNVSSAVFVSRDEAYSSFLDEYDDPMLEELDSSILRDRYIIYLDDITLMEETQEALLQVTGIDKVNAHLEIANGFLTVRNVVSAVSLVLIAILLVVSLFIMSNTVKLTTFERREEISIMKMVGATSAFIRWPFVVEGLLLGLFGSLVAYLMQWGIYEAVAESIVHRAGLSFIGTIAFAELALPLFIGFLIIGLGVGVIGSLIAIRNYLKV